MLLVMEFPAEALKQHRDNFLYVSDKGPSISDIGKTTEEANINIGVGQLPILCCFIFTLFFIQVGC